MRRAPDGPETHYLAFDGVSDHAYCDGGAVGYTSAYALVLKVAGYTTGEAFSRIAGLVDTGTSDYAYLCDEIYTDVAPAPDTIYGNGRNTGGAIQYVSSSGYGVADVAMVICVARNMTANTARWRVVRSSDLAMVATENFAGPLEDRAPDTVTVGTIVDGDNAARNFNNPVKFVAAAFLSAVPTDAQLQAYASPLCKNANTIWSSASLMGYWAAGAMVDYGTWQIPNLSARQAVPRMTLVGPTSVDLVSL